MDELERRAAAKQRIRWVPQDPTAAQRRFLELDAEDALYGGAAGGGKSSALLMQALKWADVPGYAGILFRRTYADLALPGALMDRAGEWLRPTAARWSERDKMWTFPSGAKLKFGYLEKRDDEKRYQSAEFQFVGFDELTQFQERQYRYVRSRLRRLEGFPVKPHSRGASNPGGIGHRWVKARYVDEGAPFPFVPAKIADNPHIDQEDYLARLEDLDATTRDQLRDGLWVVDANGLIYPIAKANLVDAAPEFDDWVYVLAIDLGSSVMTPTTAFSVLGYHRALDGVWCLRSYLGPPGMTPSDIAEEAERLRFEYGGFNSIVMDEGALGQGYGNEFRRRWAIGVQPAMKRDKPGFRRLIRGALQGLRLFIVKPACEELLEEAEELRFDDDGIQEMAGARNHLTDTLLYGWRECRAYAARAPKHRPAKGSPEYYRELERDELERERQDVLDAKQRTQRSRWR